MNRELWDALIRLLAVLYLALGAGALLAQIIVLVQEAL
jgi:hypothetical protein